MIGNSCKPETLRHANDEVCARLRSSARKQGDFVPLPNKFFRQPGNHTFCSTVQFWGYGFGQRSDERDAHFLSFQREHLSSLAMRQPRRSSRLASEALLHDASEFAAARRRSMRCETFLLEFQRLPARTIPVI